MKINQNTPFLKPEPAAPAVAAGKSNAVDGVAAARTTATIASPTKLPSTTGDFDAARVAEIRESIRAGSYQVDTAKIADGLLATVRDLIGRKP